MFYFSHLLCDEEMKEVIQETGMGVESIEFSIAENLDNLSKTLLSYEKRLEKMECEKLLLHGPFLDLNPVSYDLSIRKVTMERYEEAYQAAKVLGAKKIVYHTCYVPDFYLLIGWAERMAEFYREFLYEKDNSIEIVMENVLDRIPQPMAEVAEKIEHPAFGLCLDVGHANCYSKVSCEEWFQTEKKYLKHLHLHDNKGDRDSHLPLGTGTVSGNVVRGILQEEQVKTCTIECSTQEAVLASFYGAKNFSRIKEQTTERKNNEEKNYCSSKCFDYICMCIMCRFIYGK